MKKYLSLIAIAVAAGVGLNVNMKFDQREQIGITLDNIEALANGEDPEKTCYLSGSVDCPSHPVKVSYIW